MLIATRNRPTEIQTLLASLTGQKIDQIVVVASGADIHKVLGDFQESLKIDYIQSEPGQARQKINGIQTLRSDLDWVIFSDDDVVYHANFIETLRNTIITHNKPSLKGIGFQITNGKLRTNGKLKKIYNRVFSLQHGEPGSVNPSGECIPYSECTEATATMWLNGASAWRYELVLSYATPVPETKYAAFEDAIFSFGNFAPGSLVYFPNLELRYQAPENQTQLNALTLESYLLWKMFFVSKYKLSFPKCMWSSFGLCVIFLIRKNTQQGLIQRVKKTSHVLSNMIRIYFSHDREQETINVIKRSLPTA